MKYNCLRINPYVKMFVVGLLLYFGEAVFQNAGEETFTVQVKTFTGAIINVSGCKKNDMLSGFMKKFEKVYEEKINNVDLKKNSYNLAYKGKSIVSGGNPNEDKTLAELEIDKDPCLYVVPRWLNMEKGSKATNPMGTNEENEYNTTGKNEDPATSTCPCRRVCRLCGC